MKPTIPDSSNLIELLARAVATLHKLDPARAAEMRARTLAAPYKRMRKIICEYVAVEQR